MSELLQAGAPRGRQLRAAYAFAGAVAELAATLPLGPEEDVVLHGAVRLRGVGVLPRPAVVRLTAPRLVMLGHYALRPDQASFALVLVVVNGGVLTWGWAVARRPLAPGALLADRAHQVRRRQAAPWVAAFELLLIARFVLLSRSR